MSGADRYGDAQIMLRDIHKQHPDDTLTVDQKIALAQVYATLAVAGATALNMLLPIVGDGDDVTDWARLIATGTPRGHRYTPPEDPAGWPPQVGDVWQDDHDDHWLFESSGVLVRITGGPADDEPNEINRVYGPLILSSRPADSKRCLH
ncbi:hypothetical protein ABT369_28315 [Dactylosporangium sp. NPDC000244]|uniref:hypothetical protein n=1 Tax=Dactylosporangium sp. NPDC000244 TaxID=3154365 RepID=UPI00331FD61A